MRQKSFLLTMLAVAIFGLLINPHESLAQGDRGVMSPELAYTSHIIDDDVNGGSDGDGDGLVEGGESIELPLSILNTGDFSAHNVTATLSCSDPMINIVDFQESFGTVSAGETDWTNNDYDFDVSSTCPEKDIDFLLTITADEGTWTSIFTIHVAEAGLPILSYFNHLIDDDDNNSSDGDGDGIAESGESIELPLSLKNTGEALANNVSAILTCNDSDIEITDDSESFGDILVNEESWCNYNFNFDISPSCPDKDVEFILQITADEGSWTSSFTITIVHPGAPSLEYANHIIDDDDSGSSDGDGDGIAEAGETIEIPIQIHNAGVLNATDVSLSISTEDSDVIITDPFEYYPDIAPGAVAWCDNDFDIDINSNCPDKNVVFNIEIESNQGVWFDSFILHISEQGMPQLAFEELTIDDDNSNNSSGNNNGLAEPGEQIELPVLIQNIGEGNAHNVSAVLSTNDALIDISDANENYGTINAGTSDWSNNEFDFYVLSTCPEKDVIFTLTITSDEGVWSSNFTIHISITGAPELEFASFSIDDDDEGSSSGDGDHKAEPGENIEMPLSLINTGTAIAHGVTAIISCADSDISITDDSENFGTIMMNEVAWSDLDFDFTVGYGTPEKEVTFNLIIQSDEGIWNESFIVHIYATEGAPLLSFNDHLIDDDDNGSSNGNGDGIPSAGESIEMKVEIENMGDATAHSISAVLSCNDPDIDISDADESFPNLNVGELDWTNYAYDFEITSDCEDKTVMFTLHISADEGSWTSTFFVPIVGAGSPQLVFDSYEIDDDNTGESSGDNDGFTEPGETIELPILISNTGNGPVHSVYGQLSTNDPYITITDYYEQFGDITEGSQAWSYNDFDFEISEDCPEKDVIFNLLLECDEGIWNVSFLIHITPYMYYQVETTASPSSAGITEGDGNYMQGEECSVHAEANVGYEFINWTKNGSLVSSEETYNFMVEEDMSLQANFGIEEFTVTVEANPSTGGIVAGGGIYQFGESVTVTATPNPDYNFAYWSINEEQVSTNTSYTFTVSQNTHLVAHFQGDAFLVTALANPVEGGNVSGAGEYAYGDLVTMTATALGDYEFINWTENGSVVSSEDVYEFEITSNRNLIAHFSQEYYVVNATAIPSGSAIIEGDGNYQPGQNCSLDAIPNQGFYFINWQENGTLISTNPHLYFQVNEDRDLEAHFGAFDFEISVTVDPQNAGTASGGGSFNYGDETTVSAEAFTGWEFLSWTHNGTVVSNQAIYTFNVNSSMVLQANFMIAEYSITAIVNPDGGGGVEGDGSYEYGDIATVTAIPSSAYEFVKWTEDGDVVSVDPEFSFTVTADRILMAHFLIQEFEIDAIAVPAYGGNVTGSDMYDYGSSAHLTATPNANYAFTGWQEDGELVSGSLNYDFTVWTNRELHAVFEIIETVDELETSSILVYPNPTAGYCHIDLRENTEMEIIDSQGNIIRKSHLEKGSAEIDIHEQADGLYFIRLLNESGIQTIKLIKR